jgi:hypothetical protein
MPNSFRTWYKGRLEKGLTGWWIIRSVSVSGAIVAFELGTTLNNATSVGTSATGIDIRFWINSSPQAQVYGYLRQQLPQDDLA